MHYQPEPRTRPQTDGSQGIEMFPNILFGRIRANERTICLRQQPGNRAPNPANTA